MTSKTIFNMDVKLKKAAMKKARSEGWTLSAMLNFATRAYIQNRFELEIVDVDLTKAREDIRNGLYITHEELKQKMAEQRKSR